MVDEAVDGAKAVGEVKAGVGVEDEEVVAVAKVVAVDEEDPRTLASMSWTRTPFRRCRLDFKIWCSDD